MAQQKESKELSKAQKRRKQDIIEASLKVFDQKGFDAATMSDIAKEADVAKGTLYLYFDSKASLLEGVVQSAIIPTLQAVDGTAQSHEGSASDLLAKQMGIMANRLASPEMQTLLRYMMSGRSEQHQRIINYYFKNVIQKGIELLDQTVQQGVKSGEFSQDLKHTNPLAILGCQIYMTVWKTLFDDISPIDIKQLNHDLMQLLLNGAQESNENHRRSK